MKLTDVLILKALMAGLHIRRKCWTDGTCLGVDNDGNIKLIDKNGTMTEYGVVLFWLSISDWEIIEKE